MFNKIIKGFDLSKIRKDGTVEQTSYSEQAAAGYTGQLRIGMWVTDNNGKVGIVTNLLGKFVELKYVDPVTGTNLTEGVIELPEVRLPASNVRQSFWSEIPEKRKPDPAAALSKGYFN